MVVAVLVYLVAVLTMGVNDKEQCNEGGATGDNDDNDRQGDGSKSFGVGGGGGVQQGRAAEEGGGGVPMGEVHVPLPPRELPPF